MVSPRRLVALLMLLGTGLYCRAQQPLVDRQMLHDLTSDRWQVRRDAFERLAAVPDAVNKEKIQRLLIQLRQREDAASEVADPDLFENDDYLAYDEKMTPLVQEIAVKTNEPAAWKSLVYMRYNGDSVYGNWIASHQQTLPFLMEQIKSRNEVRRGYSAYVIALMLAKSKTTNSFPPEQYKSLKSLIRAHASHDTLGVRQMAIQGLGLINDPEDADFLDDQAEGLEDAYAKKLALDTAKEIRSANSARSGVESP